jgi:hypothetical protein
MSSVALPPPTPPSATAVRGSGRLVPSAPSHHLYISAILPAPTRQPAQCLIALASRKSGSLPSSRSILLLQKAMSSRENIFLNATVRRLHLIQVAMLIGEFVGTNDGFPTLVAIKVRWSAGRADREAKQFDRVMFSMSPGKTLTLLASSIMVRLTPHTVASSYSHSTTAPEGLSLIV